MRGNPSPSPKPHRLGLSQLNGELAAASFLVWESRALGKLSTHLPTLPNTRSNAPGGWVAGLFSVTSCWTGGERAP